MNKLINTTLLFILLSSGISAQENVLFRDDFNDNTYKWNYDPNRQINAYIEDSTLFINNLSSKESPARYVRNLLLCNDSNFIIETKFQFISKQVDNLAGLIWHSKDENNGFYFEISDKGKVHIWGNKFNRKVHYLAWTDFPSLNNSQWYTLKIHKYNGDLNFYVNNTKVFTSPYRGQFGVEMGFTIGKYTNIRIDYISINHPPIKESNKEIAEQLSDDDLFWIIKEEKYKAQISILGKVTSFTTGSKITNAEVIIIDTLGNELNKVKTDSLGEFSIQTTFAEKVTVKVRKDGYLSNAEIYKFSTDDKSFERHKDFQMQIIEVGKVVTLKNVLFERAQSSLLPASFDELDKLVEMMKENPNIEIELSGHTDISGNADANLILSEDRVQTVRDYLINKGINGSRITGKGYGGEFPIASNDSPLTSRLNRRVEFKIVKK